MLQSLFNCSLYTVGCGGYFGCFWCLVHNASFLAPPEFNGIENGMKSEKLTAAVTAGFLVLLGTCSLVASAHRRDPDVAQIVKIDWGKVRAERTGFSEDLIVPVAKVSRSSLRDSWGAPRDGGRTHKGIDIMAPQGSAVKAAASGTIVKLDASVRGGTTIYQRDKAGNYIFYYAHLERYAPGVFEGKRVSQGETIGFVGMSGNAPVPHLHFEIQRASHGRKWWQGLAINPYPALKSGRIGKDNAPRFAGLH